MPPTPGVEARVRRYTIDHPIALEERINRTIGQLAVEKILVKGVQVTDMTKYGNLWIVFVLFVVEV